MEPSSGADPTARFNQVWDLVGQLELGDPSCEWVKKARELISGFTAYRPRFSSTESIDAMLGRYLEFVRKEFARDEANAVGSTVAFVISTRMGDLFELKGNRVAGIEGVLTELEETAKIPAAARSLRAAYYLGTLVNNPPERAAMVSKAEATLQAIRSAEVEPYARRALATLAALHYHERNYPAAREAYGAYLKRYPTTAWSWVAALRVGQTSIEMNDLEAAAVAFRNAQTLGAAVPRPGCWPRCTAQTSRRRWVGSARR